MKISFMRKDQQMLLKLQEHLNSSQLQQLESLRKSICDIGKVCVAYSGGIDSSLIATIAQEQLGHNAIAVTGVSASLAPHLLKEAREQAKWIGIIHQECKTNELQDPNYFQNPIDRCFACKKELHSHIQKIADNFNEAQIIDGVNLDDISDHRPGITAARLAGVRSPLAELQINKDSIRTISKALGLPWWDKPAQPCLASRFPYGESITIKQLQKVANGEKWLIDNGFPNVRVRVHGLSARIEIPMDEIDSFIMKVNRQKLIEYFSCLGFTSISLDLEGLISGKLNRNIGNQKDNYS